MNLILIFFIFDKKTALIERFLLFMTYQILEKAHRFFRIADQ